MKEGVVELAMLPQTDGSLKRRPVVVLREMRPFRDWLVCGVSTQLRQEVVGFDELLRKSDADFALSGLRDESLIRLGFLLVLPQSDLIGRIGEIAPDRHRRLLQTLADYLRPTATP